MLGRGEGIEEAIGHVMRLSLLVVIQSFIADGFSIVSRRVESNWKTAALVTCHLVQQQREQAIHDESQR